MPPLPIIDGVLRCTFDWSSFGGVTPRNVLGFIGDTGSEDDLRASLQSNLTSDMFACVSSNFALEQVTILDMSRAGAAIPFPITGGISGTATGDIVPAAAGVVSFHTVVRGPRGRGRVYLGPMTETVMAAGFLEGGLSSTMQDAWQAFAAAMSADNHDLAVISLVHAEANIVQVLRVDNLQGTQRRRQDQLR